MKLTRTLFDVINFLMAVLFVIPLGVFVEQMCGYPLFRGCLIPCLAAIGFICGRLSLTSQIQKAMLLCAAGFIAATALTLFLSWGMGLATILLTLLTAFFSVFLFFTARKAAYTIYAPMAVGGILLHLLVLLFATGLEWETRVSTFTSIVSIAFFLLMLFAFSAKGLRRSMHRGSGEKRVTYPAGMQMGNFLLVAGFILVAAFISNIYPIFQVFSTGFAYVIRFIVAAFGFFTSLFDRRTVSMAVEEAEEAAASVADEDNIMAVDPKGEAGWVTMSVEIFAFICVVLVAVYFLYKILKKVMDGGVRLPAFLRDLRDKFAPVVEEDYVDESENLFDMKKVLSETRNNMKNALKKLRERPQKLDDFPDPRMKVRFAFQQMLKKVQTRNPRAAMQTPNEIYVQEYDGETDFREFLDYYNDARYSDRPLPEDAADCARAILKQKL